MSRRLIGPVFVAIAALSVAACGSTLEPRGVATTGSGVQVIQGAGAPTIVAAPSAGATDSAPGGSKPGSSPTTANVLPSQGSATTVATSGAPTTGPSSSTGPTGPTAGAHTPITVGIPYIDAAATSSVLSGIGKGLASADTQKVTELEIARINAGGGLSGHPIKPYFYDINPNTAQATYEQGTCDQFTQDHPVQIEMDPGMSMSFQQCALSGGIDGIIDTGVPGLTSSELASLPGLVYPDGISLDRLAKLEVAKLVAAHWFQPGAKIGILYEEATPYVAAEKVLESALVANHIDVKDRVAMHPVASTSDLTTLLSQAQGADLRFRTEGVTNMMFVETNAFLSGFFGLEAGPQGYDPKYAFTSDEPLGNVDANVSARELQGSEFVGWVPSEDVPGTSDIPAGGKSCMAYMHKHGQPMSTPNEIAGSIAICEQFDYLNAVISKIPAGQALTHSSFIAAVHALGSSYKSDNSFSVETKSHSDGADEVRLGDYNEGCKCFRYTSGIQSIE
jgi:hypothetical protein